MQENGKFNNRYDRYDTYIMIHINHRPFLPFMNTSLYGYFISKVTTYNVLHSLGRESHTSLLLFLWKVEGKKQNAIYHYDAIHKTVASHATKMRYGKA